MTRIHIPTALRPFTGGKASVEVQAERVGEAIDGLVSANPELARHLRDEAGKLRSFVNVYVGDEDIRHLAGLETVLGTADVTIVPSIAGGAR
jgi:molybdopterin converting factor small subunit